MTNIWYVEDDGQIACMVKEYLEERDCQVMVYDRAEAVREAFEAAKIPDLLILDWNIPGGSGMELCRWIRARWRELPVIFLTVRGDTRDIVNGLGGGADDYMTKPFELEVLYSRILALLRRTGGSQGHTLVCGEIRLDRSRMEVWSGGRKVPVSQTEYQILLLLMENIGRTVTRQSLLEQVWDSNGSYEIGRAHV